MTEFEELVDAHFQPLYRFAFSLAKDPDRAADLVQQTFVIWAQKGHQLKDRSKAKTWLFTTLYREHLGHA
ncbi:MAG: sigma factor, partial [Roseibacillus sp.]